MGEGLGAEVDPEEASGEAPEKGHCFESAVLRVPHVLFNVIAFYIWDVYIIIYVHIFFLCISLYLILGFLVVNSKWQAEGAFTGRSPFKAFAEARSPDRVKATCLCCFPSFPWKFQRLPLARTYLGNWPELPFALWPLAGHCLSCRRCWLVAGHSLFCTKGVHGHLFVRCPVLSETWVEIGDWWAA